MPASAQFAWGESGCSSGARQAECSSKIEAAGNPVAKRASRGEETAQAGRSESPTAVNQPRDHQERGGKERKLHGKIGRRGNELREKGTIEQQGFGLVSETRKPCLKIDIIERG